MAGRGKRFFQAGYELPKYMIEAKGKTLFEYSLDGLPLDIADRIIFIGLVEHQTRYDLRRFIDEKIEHYETKAECKFLFLQDVTRGQAETVLMAERFIEPSDDLLVYNIDTYFQSKNLKQKLLNSIEKKDGILGAFVLDNPDNKWSYAEINDSGLVTRTTEKIPISNYALTGMYHFSNAQDILDVASSNIMSNRMEQNEFYIAPMYNDLIAQGKEYVIDIADEFIPLGVPEDVETFANE